jgi:hypothetical protein
VSDKCDAIQMDSLSTAAARSLLRFNLRPQNELRPFEVLIRPVTAICIRPQIMTNLEGIAL